MSTLLVFALFGHQYLNVFTPNEGASKPATSTEYRCVKSHHRIERDINR